MAEEVTSAHTVRTAARRLGVDERTVRQWIRGGVLCARRLPGGAARIPAEAIAALFDRHPAPTADRLNQRNEHACFGCGRLNPFGMQLRFVGDGEGVKADFVPGRVREGWSGAMHGGIIATLLDEALGWAIFRHQIWAVTAKLNITYRHPVALGQPISTHGRIVRDRGRIIEAAGEVRDVAGTVMAEATATFVRLSAEAQSRLAQTYGIAPAVTAPSD